MERRHSGSRLTSPIDSLRNSDVVLVQYNPFMWGRWGFAPWLPRLVWRLTRRSTRPRVALMVHEAYVPRRNLRSTLMQTWQRAQLMALKLGSNLVFASIEAWIPLLSASPHRPVVQLQVGSNLPDERAARAEIRAALEIREDEITLAAFGTGHPAMLTPLITRAANAVADSGRRVRLLSLGAGAREITGLNTGIVVHTPGYRTAAELARLLAGADIYLAPFDDGVSMRRTTVVAALQHGLCIVATDGHRTDAYLRSSGAMRFAPVADHAAFATATLELAKQASERDRLGAAARHLYETDFAWPVIAHRLLTTLGLNGG